MHTHHVPHAKHMESCWSDEMAKCNRDDPGLVPLLWSLLTAMLCCPPTILFTGQWAKWIAQVLTHESFPFTFILLSSTPLLSSNCLLYFWIHSLVCHRLLSSESFHRDGTVARVTKARKLCVNPYTYFNRKPTMDRHTSTTSDYPTSARTIKTLMLIRHLATMSFQLNSCLLWCSVA